MSIEIKLGLRPQTNINTKKELQRKEAAREEYRANRLADQQSKRETLLEQKFAERKGGTDGERDGDGPVQVGGVARKYFGGD